MEFRIILKNILYVWVNLEVTLPIKVFQSAAIAIDSYQILIFGGEITSEIKNSNSFVFNTFTEKFTGCSKMPAGKPYLSFWSHIGKSAKFVYSIYPNNLLFFNTHSLYWESIAFSEKK